MLFWKSIFVKLNLPLFVFGSTSAINGIKIDTSLFVPKPYSGTNNIESNIEEAIDLKTQFGI